MQSISSFLEKFRKLEHPDHKKELLIKFIFVETGVLLKKEETDLRGKTFFVKADAYTKNEIYLRKEKLLKRIAESFPDLIIEDIR
jgi:hypothetical protein